MPHQMTSHDDKPRRYKFPHSRRLHGRNAFAAVYAANTRQNLGPITVLARPNEQGVTRLGLSVPRRVGTAPKRNRIKRLLREAFRLGQHDLPAGYDVVITVRPHEPLAVDEYREMLRLALLEIDDIWHRRARRQARREGSSTQSGRPS